MLEKVIDMDTGKYSAVSDSILYVVRLSVRIEAYVLFLAKNVMFHEDQADKNTRDKSGLGFAVYNGSDFEGTVRGLECNRTVIADALVCQKELRTLLDDKVFKIIARWIKLSKAEGKMKQACMLHANLAYLYRNVEAEDLTPRVVFSHLASQIFIFNNYKYDIDLDLSKTSKEKLDRIQIEESIRDELGVPQVELFDMFQRNRYKILRWLNSNPGQRDQVMDGIVQLVEEGMHAKYRNMISNGSESERVIRNWVQVEHEGLDFKGRFALDNEHDPSRFTRGLSKKARTNYEEWLREVTTMAVNTEINVQLGEFTIKKNATRPLEDDMKEHPDFVANFESSQLHADIVQCADVKITQNRRWVRLIGLGVDLQLWNADTREYMHPNKVHYDAVDSPWVRDIIDLWKNRLMPNLELYASKQNLDNEYVCVLYGTAHAEPDDEEHLDTLKEIVVYRYPRMLCIYNIKEHGRRLYRSLTFCSDTNFSMHALKTENLNMGDRMYQVCGDPTILNERKSSMVIFRDTSQDPTTEEHLTSGRRMSAVEITAMKERRASLIKEGGPVVSLDYVNMAKFVPTEMLHGLLPAVLLERYLFWQSEDESLTGYLLPGAKVQSRSIVKISLNKKGPIDSSGMGLSAADARVVRVPCKELSEVEKEKTAVPDHVLQYSTVIDSRKPQMFLLNVLKVLEGFIPKITPEDGPPVKTGDLSDFEGEAVSNHALVRLMLRLESVANILLWTYSDPALGNPLSIDIIELPRLHLTFKKKSTTNGLVQYVCVEQSGTYIAPIADCRRFSSLIESLPRCILLENEDKEYFVLQPAQAKPMLIKVRGNASDLPLSDGFN